MTIDIVWNENNAKRDSFSLPDTKEYELDYGGEIFFRDWFGDYLLQGINLLQITLPISKSVNLLGNIIPSTSIDGNVEIASLRGEIGGS